MKSYLNIFISHESMIDFSAISNKKGKEIFSTPAKPSLIYCIDSSFQRSYKILNNKHIINLSQFRDRIAINYSKSYNFTFLTATWNKFCSFPLLANKSLRLKYIYKGNCFSLFMPVYISRHYLEKNMWWGDNVLLFTYCQKIYQHILLHQVATQS